MIEAFFASILSFIITYIFLRWAIPRLKQEGMIGRDVNKPDRPEVAEMGGLGVLVGVIVSLSIISALQSLSNGFDMRLIVVVYSILLVGLIGVIDDILDIPKWLKFILPIVGAIPLIIYSSMIDTSIRLPIIGEIELGLIYVLLVLPLMYTGAANLTNILAGFNGLEYGLAIVNFAFLSLVGYIYGKTLIFIVSMVMLGGSIAFLLFNKYPSKVFPGDTGTLIIGGSIITSLVLDNFESLAIPVFALYGADGIIKILNGLPSKGWWGTYRDGKLYVDNNPISLPQYIMKLKGGVSEPELVMILMGIQIVIISVYYLIFLGGFGGFYL